MVPLGRLELVPLGGLEPSCRGLEKKPADLPLPLWRLAFRGDCKPHLGDIDLAYGLIYIRDHKNQTNRAHGAQDLAMPERYAHLAAEAQRQAIREIEKVACQATSEEKVVSLTERLGE